MRNLLKTVGVLALGLTLTANVSAAGLAGSWRLEGRDNQGAYTGTVTLAGEGSSYKVVWTGKRGEVTTTLTGELKAPAAEPTQRQVRVFASLLNARKSPPRGEVLTQFRGGTVLNVIREADGWYLVESDVGPVWISGRFSEPVASRAAPTGPLKLTLKGARGLGSALTDAMEDTETAGASRTGQATADGDDKLSVTWSGSDGTSGTETWTRLPATARNTLRFIWKGTDKVIAGSRVFFGRSVGDRRFEIEHEIQTNGSGLAERPRLEGDGPWQVFFQRVSDSDDPKTRSREKTDTITAEQLEAEGDGVVTVELNFFGPRWKTTFEHMMTVKDIVGSGGFRWNEDAREWDTPILDCITSAFFIAADATRMGERGIYVAPAVDNMIKTKRGEPTVENTCFKKVLTPVWGSTADFALLARSGSVFAGATAWPWNDMVWGWEGTSPMRGTVKAHVTPRTILNNLDKLGKVNILSMSQAKRPAGPDHGPMSGWTMRYEYSVLCLFKRDDGSVYCYHASSSFDPERRCRTFKDEMEYWGTDSYGSKETDVRYLVWKVDDSQIDPFYWLDDDGSEYTPPHILPKLAAQAGEPGSTYTEVPAELQRQLDARAAAREAAEAAEEAAEESREESATPSAGRSDSEPNVPEPADAPPGADD